MKYFLNLVLAIILVACGEPTTHNKTSASKVDVRQVITENHETGAAFDMSAAGVFANGATMDAVIDTLVYANLPTTAILGLAKGSHSLTALNVWPPFVLGQPRLVQVLKNGPVSFNVISGQVAVVNVVIGPLDTNNNNENDCKENLQLPLCQNTNNGNGSAGLGITSTDVNGDGCVDSTGCPVTSSTSTTTSTNLATWPLSKQFKAFSMVLGNQVTTAVTDTVRGSGLIKANCNNNTSSTPIYGCQYRWADGPVVVGQEYVFSGWIYSPTVCSNSESSIAVGVFDNANQSTNLGGYMDVTPVAGIWQQFNLDVVITSSAASALWDLQFGGCGVYLDADDFLITRIN